MRGPAKRKQGQKDKLIHGVGKNDSPEPVVDHTIVNGKKKMTWKCPYYSAWYRMFDRCYGDTYRLRSPSYRDCYVAESWHKFSVFREWMASQDWEGNQLDKDLLMHGNKVYSADSCVFVSPQVNRFLTDRTADRGLYPLGVTLRPLNGTFYARCHNPFTIKQEFIGSFSCEFAAHIAWQARKHQHSIALAEIQADPRIAEALRTRYAPGTIHL